MAWFTKSIRTLLLTACVLLVAPAAALADCGTSVIDDYLKDGTISGNYPQACYKSALKQIPTDMDIYTDVRGSINAAMNGGGSSGTPIASNNQPGATTSKDQPKGTSTGGTNEDGTTTDQLLPVAPGTTDGGLVGQALNNIGPKKADEVPMPVIVLGGLAVLLILAGAGGLIAQRRSRRGAENDMTSSDAPGAETAS